MTTFSTLLRYDYFSTPSHYVYLFQDAPLCLLFPRCCAVFTFFILLLRFDYFFHAAALCLLFQDAPLRLLSCDNPGISSGWGWGGAGVQVNPTKNNFTYNVYMYVHLPFSRKLEWKRIRLLAYQSCWLSS